MIETVEVKLKIPKGIWLVFKSRCALEDKGVFSEATKILTEELERRLTSGKE